jgi:ribose-phosphate pyrophosphokinase
VHALFSAPAAQRLTALAEEGLLNRIIVADTVCTPVFAGNIPRIEVVPSAELSSRIIRTLMLNESMGELMDSFNAETYLKSPGLFGG